MKTILIMLLLSMKCWPLPLGQHPQIDWTDFEQYDYMWKLEQMHKSDDYVHEYVASRDMSVYERLFEELGDNTNITVQVR